MNIKPNLDCNCKNKFFKKIIHIKKKPKLEIDYGIENYSRKIFQCMLCKHFINDHKFNLRKLYSGTYVKKNYKSIEGIKKNFDKIINIPRFRSDNKNRVLRICNFIKSKKLKNLNLLDIGSGLGVFPYELKFFFPKVTCVEKDKLLIEHLKNHLHLKTEKHIKYLNKIYNFITINKVLEHVPNIKIFLNLALSKLKKNGYLYLEVPDYIASQLSLVNREEFFIEHYNIFSELSLLKILYRHRLTLISMNRIKEPSGKFTLYAFCQK
jgi:2-polyprenyl-3-methyl-5-hydroxy-6-metoxy-1,4-benzoquinol methylase